MERKIRKVETLSGLLRKLSGILNFYLGKLQLNIFKISHFLRRYGHVYSNNKKVKNNETKFYPVADREGKIPLLCCLVC